MLLRDIEKKGERKERVRGLRLFCYFPFIGDSVATHDDSTPFTYHYVVHKVR